MPTRIHLPALILFVCVATTLGLSVTGCGGPRDSSRSAPGDTGGYEAHVLRVAGVFPTPIEEPWPQVVDGAFRDLAASGRIEYAAEYGIGEDGFEEALHRAAETGNDIVVADTFAAEAAARRIAAEHPDVHFFFGSGLGPARPNASVFDSWLHEATYLAGLAAGSVTKSHRIGVVAAMPGPETNRMLQAFRDGAREVDPSACLAVSYIGSWFDPPAAAEAGRRLIEEGADVLYAERLGAEQSAAEAGVPVIGNFLDQHDEAPEVTLTSVLWDLGPAVEHLVRQVEHEKYSAHDLAYRAPVEDYGPWSGLAAGGSSLAPWNKSGRRLSADARTRIEERHRDIAGGLFHVPVVELRVAECESP